ncbi:M3 family metallopeptidase [Noviherbaspirillum galbum]|uniref:Zn-dependent oligopeptidase n=1 Tax=Noviherbaspirillum galbum TaxID=2709383 RepID=A0A6B3STH7_9BURK|nr:M3 family metallopeptidase [Noviherbaspirillum galbum]NEX61702.1 Zn-dependent oligopeptidase [Noviherbaspirillum galbum]
MNPTTILRPLGATLIALAVGQSHAAAERPLIPLLKAEQVKPACDKGLASLRKQVTALEAKPKAQSGDAKKVFAEWNTLQIAIEDLQGPVEVWNNMSPDPKVRQASEACLVEISKFATDLFQSDKLYQRFKVVKPGDKVEDKVREDAMENFEDTGVALAPAKRARMKQLLNELELLSQEYARNVRDNNTKLAFTPDEVKGLPESYLSRAKRDANGNYLLGFEYPDYNPFMEYSDNEAARKRYQLAFANRGTPRNLDLLKQAMEKRLEIAKLFDLPSFAHFVIRRRMAETPEAVNKFLADVQGAVTDVEKRELEELRQFKAAKLNIPAEQSRIERWDVSYWQQKLKQERYSIDQNELRKYFPTDASVDWALKISSDLYGVDFKRVDVPAWHEEVRYYDVIDRASGQRISGMYLDLFPRDGKYNHAAAFPIRSVSTVAKRTPISVLVTNFDRQGLNADELETLVHEFGHVLHGVLSNTRYVMQAGTSVERDFVEAPSQMYEEWARSKQSLQMLAPLCKTACPTISDDMVKRMTAAHNYGRGIRYARQLLYASYDMNLHTPTVGDPQAIWEKMEGATPLGHVPGSQFPSQFGHLMGGYAAGYYGYMWSEVIALDMLSRYSGKLMNPEVGRLYRQTILERGSELKGRDLVRSFLGRDPNPKAFFDEINGQRLQ